MTEPWLRHYAPGVPHRLDVPDTPPPALLDHAARRRPVRTSLIHEGRRTGFGQLQRAVPQFAAVLQDFGIGYGDRVGLICRTLRRP
ncbi:AMP-binding protein [Streptomyces sp. NPDC047082]|uniref:AMP-binding protein n=1 Tax=Streptomyces sp. NPDC047082 TaxID=3155259 RepID=UPI00340B483B